MTLRDEQVKIRAAMNAAFSGLEDDASLAQRIQTETKGEIKMKRKLSTALVLAIAALMLSAVALAAISWAGISQLLPRTLPIQEEKLVEAAITTPLKQTHNSKLLNFGTAELYWSENGLYITIPVDAASDKYVVCGTHDIADNVNGWPPTHIWINDVQMTADEWRNGREILEVETTSGNWSASLRSEDGALALVFGIDSPDNRKLPEGMSLTLRFTASNWQTLETEYITMNLELPPMTMQEGLLPS